MRWRVNSRNFKKEDDHHLTKTVADLKIVACLEKQL